jgi:hypothetical protein
MGDWWLMVDYLVVVLVLVGDWWLIVNTWLLC